MVVLDDMSLGTAINNSSGDIVIIQLTEEEPAVEHRVVTGVGPTGMVGGNGNEDWDDNDEKDHGDWTKGKWNKGDWSKGDWQQQNDEKKDVQAKAGDVSHDGRTGNIEKREELVRWLIGEVIRRREHETRDSDVDDDDGCRCEWIAT